LIKAVVALFGTYLAEIKGMSHVVLHEIFNVLSSAFTGDYFDSTLRKRTATVSLPTLCNSLCIISYHTIHNIAAD
jgi:hypothetical protein